MIDDIQGAIFGTCFCLVTQLLGGCNTYLHGKGRVFELGWNFSFLDFADVLFFFFFADVLVPMFSVLGHS